MIVMWVTKLPCNIDIVLDSSAAIYNFTLCPRGICNSIELRDTHFVLVLWCMVNKLVPQTNSYYSKLRSWTIWTCAPSAHLKNSFPQLSRCSLRVEVHFRVNIFSHSVVLYCKLIGTTRARHRKLTSFPTDVASLSLLPFFLRREPRNEARDILKHVTI